MPNDREIMKINDVFFRIKIKKTVEKVNFNDETKVSIRRRESLIFNSKKGTPQYKTKKALKRDVLRLFCTF
jgi:hypothetical protein